MIRMKSVFNVTHAQTWDLQISQQLRRLDSSFGETELEALRRSDLKRGRGGERCAGEWDSQLYLPLSTRDHKT